jgi:hypothetical protein
MILVQLIGYLMILNKLQSSDGLYSGMKFYNRCNKSILININVTRIGIVFRVGTRDITMNSDIIVKD